MTASLYDLVYYVAALAISAAVLATNHIRHGLLRGEETILLAAFALAFVEIPAAGRLPVGAVILAALMCLIVRRTLRQNSETLDAPGALAWLWKTL